MPLETASFVDQLVPTNPAHTDPVNQGDSHIRLIKNTLTASFPNVGAAVTATAAQLNGLTADVNGRSTLANRLIGDGTVPVGSMHFFPLDPGTTLVARGGTAAGTEQFIECDGSTYATSKFPYLSASGLVTVAGPNFTVPQLNDTGRFLRARGAGNAAGTAQANQTAAHTHTLSASGTTSTVSNDHSHTFSGTTAIENAAHNHGYSQSIQQGFQSGNAGANMMSALTGATTGTENQNHGHDYSGTTSGISANHTHTVTVTGTSGSTGTGSETRPEAFVTVCVIKT